MQSSAETLLSANIAKNLADRSYEKRKATAIEFDHLLKSLLDAHEYDRVKLIIKCVKNEYAESSQANKRKGAAIGFASIAVAINDSSIEYLDEMLPSVFTLLKDEDARVRYYSCETLYNIAKVSRGKMLRFFPEIFKVLCDLHSDSDKEVRNAVPLVDRLIKDIVTENDRFNLKEFIVLMKANMSKENPYVRQLVVGWISVLNSVPDIDILKYLAELLGGLIDMLADDFKDIKQGVAALLADFLTEIKDSFKLAYEQSTDLEENMDGSITVNQYHKTIALGPLVAILVEKCQNTKAQVICRLTSLTWLLDFIEIDHQYKKDFLHKDSLIPLHGNILKGVLTCISDGEKSIQSTAQKINSELLRVYKTIEISGNDQIEVVEGIIKNSMFLYIGSSASKFPEETRIAALDWISTLLSKEMPMIVDALVNPLLESLSQGDNIIAVDLRILAKIASMSSDNFESILEKLVNHLQLNQDKFNDVECKKIISLLSAMLNAEAVYRSFAQILLRESSAEFAALMVWRLNIILLTCSELFELRDILKRSLQTQSGRELFFILYRTWCANPIAVLSLCLLSQAYELASALVFDLYVFVMPQFP
jgi:vacuole morphology and inheritance protein 14